MCTAVMRWVLLGTMAVAACGTGTPCGDTGLTLADVATGRLLFPIELSVPDMINGVLSVFRLFWNRVQWMFGISDTEIVGAKDPPKYVLQPVTPSAALQAVPLAPEAILYTPIETVSVEVDDPVRDPHLHKTKVIRRRRRRRRKKKRYDKSAIDWDLIALEAWSML